MDTLYQNRKTVIAVVLLLLAFFFVSMFFSPEPSPAVVSADPGEDLVKVVTELSGISFDQKLFQTPGYRSLVDWSTPIPNLPRGRANPFEVIGRD
ncbi:MAG: hypothetical protein A3A26_01980 [Candidatus Zambryskibacteria bacterium RIFCSPLOWO2_01_FULL_47_14]|uniref:Uncharacterized protein n=1 Tax=Candidatus Zambryskibacteria bacterium RIFCSPLOWO2_01_FULL_47_14 TaxID=1802763 RepID=A0A1G2U770_9BACT|nr:MAG: hypothetical protein A3A26_01980 [Candidatus Zambryskibacteria bacterium RIFCSPLOWO2_01_FULL_47_14]